ncbi:MAG: hypothetical protein AB8F26_02325 [Phycisphaerales bacterium]
MLKFIRKYQLIILAIGGSLLMVVFLLEPVITSFQRTQRNKTVARYADGTKIGAIASDQASMELDMAERIAPVVFYPKQQGGLGLTYESDDRSDRVHHWLMLSRMAEEAGLVGGAEDGREIVEKYIRTLQQAFIQQNMMAMFQGLTTQEELTAQAEQIASLNRAQMHSFVRSRTGVSPGTTEDDVWRMLAKFQGAYRLIELYYNAPAFSPSGARTAISELNDAAAVDAALIPGSMLAHTIAEPTEAELQAFFEPRAGSQPADDEFGIGYAQPARVQLAWLKLERAAFERAAKIDRVELQKIWQLDSQLPETERRYPGDFASERPNIEAASRVDRGAALLAKADQILRAEVLRVTRQLPVEDGLIMLSENWESMRPSLTYLSEAVVNQLAANDDVTVATPTVVQRDGEWLNANGIAALPEIGRAGFRIGARALMIGQTPSEIDEKGVIDLVGLRVGVPQVDPSAEDELGNRYYVLITDFKPAGPSESIDDAGREQVIADYKSLKGYEKLASMIDELGATAKSGTTGVADAISLAAGVLPEGVTRPGVFPNIRVSTLQIQPGPIARGVPPQLNSESFRDAVVATMEGVNPLATPESLQAEPITIAVPMPESRAVGIARMVAPRPFTEEDFRTRFGDSLGRMSANELRKAIEVSGSDDPFTLEALRSRFGLESVSNTDEDA